MYGFRLRNYSITKFSNYSFRSLSWRHARPFHNLELSILVSLHGRRIKSLQFPPPPHSGAPLLFHRSEPVLPKQNAYLPWGLASKRIAREQLQDILIVR